MDDPTMTERIERFLADAAPELGATVVAHTPISGGYSRVTALVEIRTGDGEHRKLIMRSDPLGTMGVFDSDRDEEWALLQALATVDTFVIPRPRWYDATGATLGSKAILMDHVAGTPLQTMLGTGTDVATARRIFLDVNSALKRTPIDGLPEHLTRPDDWDSYIDSAIDIYVRAEHELTDCNPLIRYVAAWLRANKPPPVPLGIVHGDFQPGNILVAEGQPPVVIDWEFTRIGDPREDIGYYSASPLPHSLFAADPDGFLAEYRAATGYTEDEVNRDVMDYFFILGMAQLFVQMMQGADALAKGESKGIMAPFLINSMCYFQEKYLEICTKERAR